MVTLPVAQGFSGKDTPADTVITQTNTRAVVVGVLGVGVETPILVGPEIGNTLPGLGAKDSPVTLQERTFIMQVVVVVGCTGVDGCMQALALGAVALLGEITAPIMQIEPEIRLAQMQTAEQAEVEDRTRRLKVAEVPE